MNKKIIILLLFIFQLFILKAQDENQDIDPSKPTNLYTQINTLAELNVYDGYNTYGTRLNFQYTFNPDNLLLAEVPFLYNDAGNNFGISDLRVRYFNVVKRNISEKVIAIAPFADITIPTGSGKNGLGSNTWSLATGAVVGLVLSKNISLFPGVNYVYLTKSKKSGLGLQTNMSVKFNNKTFVFLNPIVTFFDYDSIWQAEVNFNYIITPNKLKVNAGWYPNFTNDINTIRLGATLYL